MQPLPGSLTWATRWLLSMLTRLRLSRLSAATLIPAHFQTLSLRLCCWRTRSLAPPRGSVIEFFKFFLSAPNGVGALFSVRGACETVLGEDNLRCRVVVCGVVCRQPALLPLRDYRHVLTLFPDAVVTRDTQRWSRFWTLFALANCPVAQRGGCAAGHDHTA